MSHYHDRTLGLLGEEAAHRVPRPIDELIRCAAARSIALPRAFLEWAAFDDGSLLRKYSNDDWFNFRGFDESAIVVTPDGVRALKYHTENQNNFDCAVVLDRGDGDPPVLFGWLGGPPWVTYAARFSDAVFAQVFDWQYRLEFRPDDPAYKEIAPTGEISLASDRCVRVLREQYEEAVSTRILADGRAYSEYRFHKSPELRVTVQVADDRSTELRVTAASTEGVRAFEGELRSRFKDAGVA